MLARTSAPPIQMAVARWPATTRATPSLRHSGGDRREQPLAGLGVLVDDRRRVDLVNEQHDQRLVRGRLMHRGAAPAAGAGPDRVTGEQQGPAALPSCQRGGHRGQR